MGTVKENHEIWNKADWTESMGGESWSLGWGGSENLWHGSLYFRLHQFLPARTILEIAPGHGRLTQYLKNYCYELHVVDLGENCIAACRERFKGDTNISYHVNDGLSLSMIPDNKIDLVFSFDSLVHADAEVFESYLSQLSRKLKTDGVGFIHHSNFAAYVRRGISFLPANIIEAESANPGWRSCNVDANVFEEIANRHGLSLISQELIPWGAAKFFDNPLLIDCISLFTPKDSKWARQNRTFKNPLFNNEIALFKQLSDYYSGVNAFG